MTSAHFAQHCDGPIFVGAGPETLVCDCGNVLIAGYDPARFIGIGIQCQQCMAVTLTPPLPEGAAPPFAVIIAEPALEPRAVTTTLPESAYVIGRAEMDRLEALYRPRTPPDNTYRITAELLDQAQALFERHVGGPMPVVHQGLDGLRDHALAWAVRTLRDRIQDESRGLAGDAPTSNAVTHVAGFVHFVATWSHHPLFPAMVHAASQQGFSLHGLAPFAAAHCLTMMGNRISFPSADRITAFNLATGPTDIVQVQTDVFARFDYPFGAAWDAAGLRAAVSEHIGAAQSRINLRNPGLLLLSPGSVVGPFDETLIEAIKTVLPAEGRRNRGLMAVAPIVLRLQPLPDPHAVRFGYGLFPITNRHYRGDTAFQA